MSWNDDIKKIMAMVPHIESLQKELSKPKKESHDYRNLAERLSKLEQTKPQKYDDSKIKKEIEQVKLSIPKTYDDIEVKTAVSQLLKYYESQNVTINSLSEECCKINELLNVINNRDKTIKDLKLDLKRAESSARNCEELMLNMERKVNELSARLNNGN